MSSIRRRIVVVLVVVTPIYIYWSFICAKMMLFKMPVILFSLMCVLVRFWRRRCWWYWGSGDALLVVVHEPNFTNIQFFFLLLTLSSKNSPENRTLRWLTPDQHGFPEQGNQRRLKTGQIWHTNTWFTRRSIQLTQRKRILPKIRDVLFRGHARHHSTLATFHVNFGCSRLHLRRGKRSSTRSEGGACCWLSATFRTAAN